MTLSLDPEKLENPFRPGAGHMPPYLAGRDHEEEEFRKALKQKVILQNLIITGLRGVGKTVLLESLKPVAIQEGWYWVGTDLSESVSVSEHTLALRLLTDLSIISSNLTISENSKAAGFIAPKQKDQPLNYFYLINLYANLPGIVADKLKLILELVWDILSKTKRTKGIVFAYDEAQNLTDQAKKEQYPLSVLLDVFQSIQRKNIPFLLVLTGLPTLPMKLVEARTYSERMFHTIFLHQLTKVATEEAISKPIELKKCPISFDRNSVNIIYEISGGYPYFIQYVCKETYDTWIQQHKTGRMRPIPQEEILRKLDTDFYAGRWARATDRQKELLKIISGLKKSDNEFTIKEIVGASLEDKTIKPFTDSHVSQLLGALCEMGMIYNKRFSKYSFAVPLLKSFIERQRVMDDEEQPFLPFR